MKSVRIKLLLILIIISILNITPSGLVSSASATLQGAQEEIDTSVQSGFDYISAQINEDGGIRWADERSSVAASLRVLIALAANGFSQDQIISATGIRPLDYLKENGVDWVYQKETDDPSFDAARAGQLLTAIAAANENPQVFGVSATNIIYELNAAYDPMTGIYGNATENNVIDQVWAMVGLAANHFGIPEEASRWLADAQLNDGSWDDGYSSFLDTTPLAIMALTASGWELESEVIQLALQYLLVNQNEKGGWQTQWDSTSNPDTTGMILQSLSASGLDYNSPWANENRSPQSALLEVQQDNGSFGADYANAFSTADALIGLSGQPLFQLGLLKRVSDGFDYLVSEQDQNGGWGSPGQTIDSMMAFTAAGWDPNTISIGDITPEEFLIQNLETYLESGPDAVGKSILAAVISGKDPTNFEGVDLLEILINTYDIENYTFGDPQNTWHQSLGILGLYATNQEIPEGIVESIIGLQQSNGGWAYSLGMVTTPDTTALVIQSLLAGALPKEDISIQKAIGYLRSTQTVNGGWGDSSTTGYVIMAINALGQTMDEWAVENGKDPINALLSYQNSNGAFYYNADYSQDSLMSTTTSLIALTGNNYFIQTSANNNENNAGVLVLTENEIAQSACASFKEPDITGFDLLEISEISYDAQDGFMNKILGIGNPEGDTLYWSYWHWDGREWVFNTSGAADSEVLPGSIEAWYLTSWEQFPSLPPRVIPDIKEICGTEILKNYSVHPFLNFSDLMISEPDKPTDAEPTETATLMISEQAQVTPTELPEIFDGTESTTSNVTDQNPALSPVPIFIIAAVGLSTLVIVVLILKKQK